MIIALIILSVFGVCLCVLNNRIYHRNFWMIILTIITLGLQSLALADTHYQFGTIKESIITQRQIQPMVSFPVTNSVLLYRNIKKGTDNKQIYVYKYTKKGRKKTTYTDKIKVKLVRSESQRATRSTQVTSLRYINRVDKILFTGINNDGQIVKTTVSFHLPRDWQVMTTKQVKAAGNKLKNSKGKLKKIVKAQLSEYFENHPEAANNPQNVRNESNRILNEQVKKVIETP